MSIVVMRVAGGSKTTKGQLLARQRSDHYMPLKLLNFQFAILKKPQGRIKVNIESKREFIVPKILKHRIQND